MTEHFIKVEYFWHIIFTGMLHFLIFKVSLYFPCINFPSVFQFRIIVDTVYISWKAHFPVSISLG